MKSTLTRILVLAVFVSTGLLVHAQDTSPVVAPIEYLRPMKNSFSIGVRMIGGANVTFSGNLGVTSYTMKRSLIDGNTDSDGNAVRIYNNGTVSHDSNVATGNRPIYDPASALVGSATMPNGNPIGVDGRFYTILTGSDGSPVINGDGSYTITGDYLMHNESMTRNWSYTGTSQFSSDGSLVGMSAYSTEAYPGASVNASNSKSPGIELTMGRVIQRFKRFEWGVSVGFAIAEFNAKTRQTAPVNLKYITDWYQVYNTGTDFKGTPTAGKFISSGTAGTTAETFPTFATTGTAGNPGDLKYDTGTVDDSGNPIYANGTRETTNPISTGPVRSDGADGDLLTKEGTVDGFWQVKGVYYIMRVGPMVRIPIGKRFSAYLSGGYMAAYVGSKFRYDENVVLPDNGGTINIKSSVLDTQDNEKSPFKSNQQYMGGYYFDANFEWWLTTRTGFYVGVGYEKLGKYEQNFDGRKATVKMDNGIGWRFGIMTRF